MLFTLPEPQPDIMAKKAKNTKNKETAPVTVQLPATPVTLPECFAALSAAVGSLDALLNTQEHDWTPLILTQPPSRRASRREILETTLAQLDAQQTDLQRTIDSLSSACDKLHRQYGMCKSALSPASALPYDVLRCIFDRRFLSPVDQVKFTKLCSSVCRDWRKAACEMPRLWASFSIDTLESLQYIEPWLERSGTSNLIFDIDIDDLGSPSWFKRVDDHTLLTIQERVSKLSWRSPDKLSLLIRGLFDIGGKGVRFSSLRNISINAPWDEDEEDAWDAEDLEVDLGHVFFPKLQRLELAVPVIGAGDDTFPELKRLEIGKTTFEDEHWDLIRRAKQLEYLQMAETKSTGISYLIGLPTTDLLLLDDLEIFDCDVGVATTVLRLLHMPNLTYVNIDILDVGHEPPHSPWGQSPPDDPAAFMVAPHLSNRLHNMVGGCAALRSRMLPPY